MAHALDVFAPLCRRVHIVSGRSSASAARCDGRRPAESEVVEFGHLFGAQGDGAGRYVLLDPGYPFGARYRRDVVALGEEPGQCGLRRRGTAFGLARRLRQDRRRRSRTSSRITSAARRTQRHLNSEPWRHLKVDPFVGRVSTGRGHSQERGSESKMGSADPPPARPKLRLHLPR